MTNKELNIYIEKYKNGDQEAFNVIYQETYQSVYYTIYLLTKNTTIIEDFVQDTYLKVIDKIDSYKIGTNFKAWICTIAHNLSVNGLIQKSKEIPVELSSQTEYIFGPAPKNDTRIYKALEILEGEEKDFYLRNNLFLNPLNIFDLFLSAQNEEFDELLLDESSKQYFSEIVDDYKVCRKNLFQYHQCSLSDKRTMAMVYSYTYTIFDKIAFLIKNVYDLNIGERFYFNGDFFRHKLKINDVCLGKIKNDNILPLYLLASDVNDTQDENNRNKVISIESLKLRLTRNQIEHRSLALVDIEVLKRNALILLKNARNTILHTFMLIHSCPIDKSKDKITTIGTTYYQAVLNIVKEGNHKDLIK